ncbi:MAG: succinate dehydrogenase assembly factor 2 [Cellvibrio sp.]|nr:succinate dehydrogenase assembly factor 2 [Cellvibrio sp.]
MDEKRLVWASRRGMLELDLILLPFLEKVYPTLGDVDKQVYQQLLAEEDQDIYAWCMRREDPEDKNLHRIVEIIRANTGLQPNSSF